MIAAPRARAKTIDRFTAFLFGKDDRELRGS
jgi:hypothetical protein